jgi:hypothetical protein
VPGTDAQRVVDGVLEQLRVVPGAPHEPCPGGLAEGQPEPDVRVRADQRLVQVLDGLDEVRLPDQDGGVLGLADSDGLEGDEWAGHAEHGARSGPTGPGPLGPARMVLRHPAGAGRSEDDRRCALPLGPWPPPWQRGCPGRRRTWSRPRVVGPGEAIDVTRPLPALPVADLDVAGAVPLEELARIADTHARLVWGPDIARGEPIIVSDRQGRATAFEFPYALGASRFPPFSEIFQELRAARSAAVATSGPPEPAALGRFGAVTVSATRSDVPVLRARHFLPPCFTAADEARDAAERAAGEVVELSRFHSFGPHEDYFEFAGERSRVVVRAETLEVCDDTRLLGVVAEASAERPERRPIAEALWRSATAVFPSAVEAEDAGATHTVKTLPLLPLVPVIPWTWWCVPTSNAMALGFWDNVVAGQPAILGFGRLISHWFEHTHNKNCHDAVTGSWKTCNQPGAVHNNVPSILDEMIDPATETWRKGYADQPDFIKKRFGYTFTRHEHPATEGSEALWQALVGEIDAGHPVVWTVPGHSVTAVGYRSGPTGKFAIVYNTWGTHAEIGKLGSQYEEIAYTACDGLACIVPGGGDGGNNLAMVGPDGGEILDVGTPTLITWHVWGDQTARLQLDRSIDGGNSWGTIADLSVGPGFGQHPWVPDVATGKLRIRVRGLTGQGAYVAGDSSQRNLTVRAKPATGWGPWRALGKPGFDLATLAVGRNGDGRVEAFATAANGELRHCYQAAPDTEQWIGWGNLARPVGRWLRTVAVHPHADGRLGVFCLGDDGACWHRAQASPSAGPWTDWTVVGRPRGAALNRIAVAANADGRVEVLAVGSDHALWHCSELGPNSGTWSAWESLGVPPAGFIPTTVSAGRNADGRLEAFLGCVVPDGTEFGILEATVWHQWQTAANGGPWSGWYDVGPSGTAKVYPNPVVGANSDGRLEVFDTNGGQLRHGWQTAPNQNQWTGWSTLDRPAATVFLGGSIAVSRTANARLSVVTVGYAGTGPSTFTQCWSREQHTPSDGWAGWTGLDSPPGRSVMALAPTNQADGRRDLFVLTSEDRALWHVTEG